MRNGVLTFSAAFLWLEGALGVAKDERMYLFSIPGGEGVNVRANSQAHFHDSPVLPARRCPKATP